MRRLVFLLFLLPLLAFGEDPLTADQIMARVAANQDAAQQMRAHYVYKQHIHVSSKKTSGKMMREETSDYDVTPKADTTEKKLARLDGRYWHKGKYETYNSEPVPEAESFDGDLVTDFRRDLVEEKEKSKDGMSSNMFPLTSKRQQEYVFHLIGETVEKGRPAYRIGFEPKDKDDISWAGEAVIDKEEFQPVRVFTKMSRKLPFFVRGVLGVNLPGVGFTVDYQRIEKDVWFPKSYGAEFRIALFHVMSRDIAISMLSSEFEKTHVESKISVPGQ